MEGIMNGQECIDKKSPCRKGTGAWSIERQVRLTSGILVLAGIALAYSFQLTWILLSIVVGLGMVLSAVLDTCALGSLIAQMPWNRHLKS